MHDIGIMSIRSEGGGSETIIENSKVVLSKEEVLRIML